MATKPWRTAKSLMILREQINKLSPNRSIESDGTIGNAEHATRSSDHNPWVQIKENGKTIGIVTGLDITNDPPHGVDSSDWANAILGTRDPRIKYIIADGQIAAGKGGVQPWVWRKYTGPNSHHHHFHLSVKPQREMFDNEDLWKLPIVVPPEVVDRPPSIPVNPVLAIHNKGADVKRMQQLLVGWGATIVPDGDFGDKTRTALMAFQKSRKLTADGICGRYTWEALSQKPESLAA